MKFNLWTNKDQTSLLFIPEDYDKTPYTHEQCDFLLKTFTADSWEDACKLMHEWQGWTPHKPIS